MAIARAIAPRPTALLCDEPTSALDPDTTESVVGTLAQINRELGVTLVHEHVLLDVYEVTLNAVGVLLDETLAIDEVGRFRAAGGVTLVDQSSIGLNPDLEGLRRISLATGVHIIASTGVYWRRFRPA